MMRRYACILGEDMVAIGVKNNSVVEMFAIPQGSRLISRTLNKDESEFLYLNTIRPFEEQNFNFGGRERDQENIVSIQPYAEIYQIELTFGDIII